MKNWQKVLIRPETQIIEALKIIDDEALQIALVIDVNNKLLGTITDGDVRRGLLRGLSVNSPAEKIMNRSPQVLLEHDSRDQALRIMKKSGLLQLPVVDKNGLLLGLESLQHFWLEKERSNFVVLMAGGLGERLAPLTSECPKPMLKVGNKPILQTIIESFIDHGFKNFYISINYKAEIIREYFGDGSAWNVAINYLHEDKPLGTAGALSLLPKKTVEPILVMNGDILTKINFAQLVEYHCKQQAAVTMGVRSYEHQVPYGVVSVVGNGVEKITEKPWQRFFVNGGIYVVNQEAIKLIPEDTYYDMPQLLDRVLSLDKKIAAFPIREYWLDIGHMSDFNRANQEFFEVFS